MTPTRVAGVAVTYNRSAVLAETLHAAQAQSRPPDRLYVIDNASDDDTADVVRREFPDVVYLRMPENLGFPGGVAHGIDAAQRDGYDAYWLVDDDSAPESDALETLTDSRNRGAGVVGSRGGFVRFGLIRHRDDPRVRHLRAERSASADFVLLDGSLVLRSVIDSIGVPRVDYFMMLEDVEYSLRARRAGFEILVTDRDRMRRRHLGSAPGTALWRGHYQSRNHVRMALDFRSPTLLFGCIARQVRLLAVALRAPDRRWERVKLRSLGVWHGLRGRMGRRIDPESH
jgi:rhamnopyranosyl-N-acetylglucosaminyl-diphospho-decaprenol beta-1,3/1,4-galactofuranosyltransferase